MMSSSREALLVRIAVVGIAVVAGGACGITSPIGLPCESDTNCPDELACVKGACRDAATIDDDDNNNLEHDRRFAEPTPIDFHGDGGGVVVDPDPTFTQFDLGALEQQGSAPHVIAHDGVVEVWLLAAPCQGIARAHVGANNAVDLDILAGAAPGCFVEMDVKRAQNGVTHVAARRLFDDGSSGLVLVNFDDSGAIVGSADEIDPADATETRGLLPQIAISNAGAIRVTWLTVRQDGSPARIETEIGGAPPFSPGNLIGAGQGLASAYDSGENYGLFSVDVGDQQRLDLSYLGEERFLEDEVTGAIDAEACGADTINVVYRKNDEFRVASVTGSDDAAAEVVADALPTSRNSGDVAIACDSGTLWVAHSRSDGVLTVAQRIGVDDWREQIVDDAVASPRGGVTLAVVNGVPHVGYLNGGVAYYAAPAP